VVVRPSSLLSLLSGRWARVSSPPLQAQMRARCYRSQTSSLQVDGVVELCLVGCRKAACLVVESCKSGRVARSQRNVREGGCRERSRTAEKAKSTGGKVGR
jgi:hypothetical protein